MSQNVYNDWINAQKDMYQQWQKVFENKNEGGASNPTFTPFNFGNMNNFNPLSYMPAYQEFNKAQQNYVDTWQTAVQNNPAYQYVSQLPKMDSYLNELSNLMNPYNMYQNLDTNSAEVFKKIMDSNKIYESFYKLYDQFTNNVVAPSYEEFEKMFSQWADSGKNAYETMVEPFIPEQLRSFTKAPAEIMENITNTSKSFWAPWDDSAEEMRDLYSQALSGDRSKLTEFYEQWKANYNNTVGLLIQAPLMGNQAETMEIQNKYFDQALKLYIVSMEFFDKIGQVSTNQVKDHVKEYYELIQKNEQPKTYKEFYKYWSNLLEGSLNEYFYTDEFSEVLANFADAYAQYKINTDALIESNLANTPIVLESDMKSVYKKVYDLQREVRKLTKEVKELTKAKEEVVENPAKTTTAANKATSTRTTSTTK